MATRRKSRSYVSAEGTTDAGDRGYRLTDTEDMSSRGQLAMLRRDLGEIGIGPTAAVKLRARGWTKL